MSWKSRGLSRLLYRAGGSIKLVVPGGLTGAEVRHLLVAAWEIHMRAEREAML